MLRRFALVIISGCHWSYSTSAFGGASDGLRSWPEDDSWLHSTAMSAHRKTVKRFHEPGDCHELTFWCYRRIPLLTNDEWRQLLAESLDRAVHGQSCRLIASVFMPEHVHILIQPTSHEVRMDLFLKMKKTLVGYDQWHP